MYHGCSLVPRLSRVEPGNKATIDVHILMLILLITIKYITPVDGHYSVLEPHTKVWRRRKRKTFLATVEGCCWYCDFERD